MNPSTPSIVHRPSSIVTPAFALDRIGYVYPGGATALRDVSLTIERGESVALLGANGSGKSTLLKILNGLIAPTSGRLVAFGEEINPKTLRDEALAARFRRRVGFIFQNSDAQLFSSTVRDEIAFGPLQMNLTNDEVEQRIADVSVMLGITPLLDRPPYQLSGGEKKKVAIASVLVMNPEAILLDEPTAALDPRSQGWLIEVLAALSRAGKTIVTATHDLDVLPAIAERVVVLNEAHTVEVMGPTCEVLEDHALLLHVNLIHEHTHRHGSLRHSHVHYHADEHAHEH